MFSTSGSPFGDNIVIDVIMFIAAMIQGVVNLFS